MAHERPSATSGHRRGRQRRRRRERGARRPVRHDPAFKRYFSLTTVVEDLLRAFAAPDWAQSLDFSTLSDASSEFVDETLHTRCGDMVWRVCFRHGTLADGARRYLFVLLEFQSSVDAHMQGRMRRYTDALLERLTHNGVHTREGELSPVLPVVLYNGNEPWTAQGSAPPGWATPGHAEALPDRERRALARFRSQAYHLVDIAEWRGGGWPEANRVSAWARLQHAGTPKELLERLSEEMARRPGVGEEPVRRALHAWAGEWWGRLTDKGPQESQRFPPFEEMERAGGERRMATIWEAKVDQYKAGLLAQGIEQGRAQGIDLGIKQGIEQGIERGIKQGLADGEQRALCRVAARRFGDDDAERLRPLLRRVPADGLPQVGDWLVDCKTGEEVIRRVEALAANGSPAGHA